MNKTQLESWDRNAPLPDANTKLIDWNEAKEIVIEAYEEFSVDIAIIVKKFFEIIHTELMRGRLMVHLLIQ